MSYKIVVARYNENVDWLKKERKNCVIYNKGKHLRLKNEIQCPNKGRESETYLRYIIENYNELPDIIVFTQGKIQDHLGKDDINILLNLKNQANLHNKSQLFLEHYKSYINWDFDPMWNYKNGNWYLKDNYKNNEKKLFINWFQENIQSIYPNPIRVYKNGIFAVKKEYILKHPIKYYIQLRDELTHHDNPAEGHFFERSWYYIFD